MMWSKGVVEIYPITQCIIETLQIQLSHVEIIKLLCMGPLCSFQISVQLRGPGRKDKETDILVSTSLFKLGHELAAPIHLDATY